jgi:Na+/proline symporter/nitrogen-specific signal transduction histidine kinase
VASSTVVIVVALAYLGVLFAIAWYGDRRAQSGRSLIRSPLVYTLSLGVYCTSWTFYGAVGTAARRGVEFITIYTGPTIVFLGWWFLLRKISRISKSQRITSIADFIASRYGKSALLGMLVTVIAMVGAMPYIALQLKAVSTTFAVLVNYSLTADVSGALARTPPTTIFADAAFLTAIGMAVFAILFGTRHIDANEHHEGMVAAIAFESCVKFLAFLAVGIYVVIAFGAGIGEAEAKLAPALDNLILLPEGDAARFLTMTFLSMAAIFCLPRQFHITIVENVNERHLATAAWLFPLYLLLMSLFALPIAATGLTLLPPEANPDFYVLTVPITQGQNGLALLAFIGGLSSATAMIVVEAIALSTMVCNDLVMPALLRIRWLKLDARGDLTQLLLFIRRAGIFAILLLGYAYYRVTGESGPLAQIGLVSFAVVAQFVPAIVGGLFWRNATRLGAVTGLVLGFLTWAYTMLVPLLARSGVMPEAILDGPWQIALLQPEALFGLTGWDPLTHALFWSMAANIGGYVLVSLFTRQNLIERVQAIAFVDVFRRPPGEAAIWHRSAALDELTALLQRFIGPERAARALSDYAQKRGVNIGEGLEADTELIAFVERLLAGSIGAASARAMVAAIAKGETLSFEEMMAILEETQQVIAYSRELEQKSRELEVTARELTHANAQLKELDRLKDDFLSTVSHELRTPLTSIRSFSEILSGPDDLAPDQAERYLAIIQSETQRLTRLLDTILDLTRLEQGQADWSMGEVDPAQTLEDAVAATGGLFRSAGGDVDVAIESAEHTVHADRDRMMQVFINLLSNAAKFADPGHGHVRVAGRNHDGGYLVEVTDNGEGVKPQDQQIIFEKFAKAHNRNTGRPSGSGLGLAISRHIVEHHGGRIWVTSPPGKGATFSVFLPGVAGPPQAPATAPDLAGAK